MAQQITQQVHSYPRHEDGTSTIIISAWDDFITHYLTMNTDYTTSVSYSSPSWGPKFGVSDDWPPRVPSYHALSTGCVFANTGSYCLVERRPIKQRQYAKEWPELAKKMVMRR